MSSDDSGDSGFDKEAEREKLREKYENEKDRENTRRMSELLLKGATMTGKHCGECGDPIFRYDGQEFCPTCQREVEGGGSQQDEAQRQASGEADEQSAQGSAGADASAENGAPTGTEAPAEDPDSDRTGDEAEDAGRSDDEPRVEINDVRVADQHADRSNLRQPPSQQGERDSTGHQRDRTDRQHRSTGHQRDPHDHSHGRGGHSHGRGHDRGHTHDRSSGRASAPSTDAGDLATARDSLVRKLTDLARRAEETDDVARSRDLLAATREAAEALAALDRVDR